jgi:hypothetical protein
VTRHMNDFSDEFSEELEEKIAELVAAGCDRQELLSRLQLFLMACAAGPERKRVLEDLVGRPARSQLQRIRKVIRMTATEIRKLQLMLPLHPVPVSHVNPPHMARPVNGPHACTKDCLRFWTAMPTPLKTCWKRRAELCRRTA